MFSRVILAAGIGLILCATATAGTTILGTTGWEATWDPSLDPYVDINFNGATSSVIFIQKSAEFIQGPDEFSQFPSIPITFQQTGPSTITQIVIQDEIITNSTGFDWTDFHFDLLDGEDAFFDNGPGFFFTTSPLDNQSFSGDLQSFWVDGFGLGPNGTDAVVPAGSVWFPGDGASDGNLVIDVFSNSGPPFTTFTLKETPTPEPVSLALMAMSGLAILRRRR